VIATTHPAGAGARPPRPHRGGRAALAAALLFACLAPPDPACAHGTPVEFVFWGDFPPAIAACQRAIGRAGAACGLQAWRLRRDCALSSLRGAPCDESAVDSAVQHARLVAQTTIDAACDEMQVQLLQFLGVFEALRDVNTFCRDLERATTSLLLDPIATAAISPADLTCIDTATRAGTKLLNAGFRSRQRLLDRVAGAAFSPPRKRLMRAASTAQIGTTVAALSVEIERSCPAHTFGSLYAGQTATEVLSKIASRADCLAGQTYAQGGESGIICPPSTCGNRMIERDEECDDGNALGGDDCSVDCLNE